jgi:hypothetical protein
VLPLSALSKGAEVNEFFARVIELAVAYNSRGLATPLTTLALGAGVVAGVLVAVVALRYFFFNGDKSSSNQINTGVSPSKPASQPIFTFPLSSRE